MKKLLLNSKSFVIAFVIANLFLFNVANAQTNTWTGTTSTAWATGTNWSLAHAPLAAEDVVIPNSTTIVNWPNLAASTTIKSLTMTGRTAAAGDRGGSVTINTAGVTLTITGNLTINGSTGGTTENTLTGITLTGTNSSLSIGGNIATTNGTTVEQPEITLGTGTLTVGGNITIGTTVGFTVSNGSLVFNGAAAQTVTSATAAARTYNNLTLSGAGNKTLASGTILNGKLTLQGAGALVTNAPTYGATSTLEYAGSAAQTSTNIEFPAASGPANLIINNANGVTLNANKTVATTLTLTSGKLIIPTGITLTLTSTNAIAGASLGAANCIVTQVNTGTGAKGILRVNVPAGVNPRVIPVSNGTNYLPVTTNNATAASGYNITVFNGLTTNSAPNGTPFSAAAKSECVDIVWNVNLVSGSGTVTITLDWGGVLEGSKFALLANQTFVGIAQNIAGIWDIPLSNSGTLHSSTTRNFIGVTATSSFGIGTIYAGAGPLPIKVNYFNAAKGNGYNTLNWSAESTSESATFDIERSADGKNFTAINTIVASRLDMLQPFNYVDNSIVSGTVYYRIKITDFNGKVTYSSVVRIASAVNDMKLVAVLPNPVSNTAQLNVVSAKKDNVQLSVVSMTGQLVQRSNVQLQSGSSIINLDVTNLQSGMYTIKGTFSDGTVSTVKFVKQ